MNIVELYDRIANHEPTVMDAEKEIFYFERLMSIPIQEIIDHPHEFDGILSRLSESHTDVFFEVNENNEQKFNEFVNWLANLGEKIGYSEEESANLAQFAENFRGPNEEFKKKYGKRVT